MKFISIAKTQNKIKSITDPQLKQFEEFNIYNWIFECTIKYNNYEIGDIVFVYTYKYKNGSVGSNHMFLIVDIVIKKQETIYYGMLISSKIEKLSFKYNIMLEKDHKNNLKRDSIIKTDVIYKIFTKNILLKIGKIDKTKVEIYKNCLINNN